MPNFAKSGMKEILTKSVPEKLEMSGSVFLLMLPVHVMRNFLPREKDSKKHILHNTLRVDTAQKPVRNRGAHAAAPPAPHRRSPYVNVYRYAYICIHGEDRRAIRVIVFNALLCTNREQQAGPGEREDEGGLLRRACVCSKFPDFPIKSGGNCAHRPSRRHLLQHA